MTQTLGHISLWKIESPSIKNMKICGSSQSKLYSTSAYIGYSSLHTPSPPMLAKLCGSENEGTNKNHDISNHEEKFKFENIFSQPFHYCFDFKNRDNEGTVIKCAMKET